ncbi:ras GTPase-activating protein SynGAP [Caerostris darwini]|uniref:Ras GTPase-activating protein SynGAP n=1 Tax=Caerostris darwini TaxID=1538125 RepID=A0AAV4ST15_9ARAC|nr:ras GTPase-activating protein SynGAP [Caerostris darwini]
MLTESVSDPRRANWLTITSMSEDLCWPDEPSTTRPNWELEAEILRLTTRLMMRERELRQVKNQLKMQTSKTQQQNMSWRRRIEEKEDQMKELLVQKDAEMQNIVSQLILFEAELRREQSRIEDLLSEKDAQIASQQQEIERLRRTIETKTSNSMDNSTAIRGSNSSLSSLDISDKDKLNRTRDVRIFEDALSSDSQHAVQKLKDGLVKIRAIQDVTNVKTLELSQDSVIGEKKRIPYRAPQKMKDLKAKRINPHKGHHRVSEMVTQAIL